MSAVGGGLGAPSHDHCEPHVATIPAHRTKVLVEGGGEEEASIDCEIDGNNRFTCMAPAEPAKGGGSRPVHASSYDSLPVAAACVSSYDGVLVEASVSSYGCCSADAAAGVQVPSSSERTS